MMNCIGLKESSSIALRVINLGGIMGKISHNPQSWLVNNLEATKY